MFLEFIVNKVKGSEDFSGCLQNKNQGFKVTGFTFILEHHTQLLVTVNQL